MLDVFGEKNIWEMTQNVKSSNFYLHPDIYQS